MMIPKLRFKNSQETRIGQDMYSNPRPKLNFSIDGLLDARVGSLERLRRELGLYKEGPEGSETGSKQTKQPATGTLPDIGNSDD